MTTWTPVSPPSTTWTLIGLFTADMNRFTADAAFPTADGLFGQLWTAVAVPSTVWT